MEKKGKIVDKKDPVLDWPRFTIFTVTQIDIICVYMYDEWL